MVSNSVVGIRLRLIRAAKRTFKFPDAIEADMLSVLQAQNIRGTFSLRSLRAAKSMSQRTGFIWTAADESEGLIRFTYQPSDGVACVRYTLTPDECGLSLSEIFNLLRSGAVVAPKPLRTKVSRPLPVSTAAAGGNSQAASEQRLASVINDPVDALLRIDLSPKEVQLRLNEIAAMLERTDVVKTEMYRLAKLYAEEKEKLRKVQGLLNNPRYTPLLAAFELPKE